MKTELILTIVAFIFAILFTVGYRIMECKKKREDPETFSLFIGVMIWLAVYTVGSLLFL